MRHELLNACAPRRGGRSCPPARDGGDRGRAPPRAPEAMARAPACPHASRGGDDGLPTPVHVYAADGVGPLPHSVLEGEERGKARQGGT
jgi:hypothetical protein